MSEKTKQQREQGLIDRIKNHPYGQLIGIEVGEDGDEEPAFYIDIENRHRNPGGIMHGGVALALADTAGGYSVVDGTDFFVTLNQEYHFLKRVQVGDRLFAKAKLISDGYKIKVVEVEMMVGDEKVGHAVITYYRTKGSNQA